MTAEQLTLAGTAMPTERDSVYTPPRLADACVARLIEDGHLWAGSLVVEPSAGSGSFVRSLVTAGCSVIGVDDDPGATAGQWCDRFFSGRWEDLWERCREERPHAVVGNPPFGGPHDPVPYVGAVHVELARRVAPVVAFVLPAAWALYRGEVDPWTLFGAVPSVVYPIRGRAFKRPNERGEAVDCIREAALFGWRPQRADLPTQIGEPIVSPVGGWLS